MAPKKKGPKNAFYYFMLEVKEAEEEKGRTFKGGLKGVAEFASPLWNEMTPEEKEPYNRYAAKMKRQECEDLTKKFTSLGVSYAALDAEERELEEANRIMTETVRSMVRSVPRDGGLKDYRFFVAHVNYFYKNSKEVYIPAEFAIAAFSLQEGIVDRMHFFIDPGFSDKSHLGFRYEANDWSQKTHNIPFGDPQWKVGERSYYRVSSRVMQFIKGNNLGDNSIPPIFTMPDSLNNNTSISAVKSFFQMLTESDDNVPDSIYRIYPLPLLFFELRNHCVEESTDALCALNQAKLPTVAMAENEVEKDIFAYAKNLGCEYHEERDLSTYCSLSIVYRWIFTICDHCCMHVGVQLALGRHCPHDADIDRFAHLSPAASHSTSSLPSSSGWKTVTNDLPKRKVRDRGDDQMGFMPTIVDHGKLMEERNIDAQHNSDSIQPPPVTPADVRLPVKSSYSAAIKSRLPGTSGVIPQLTNCNFPQVGEASASFSRHQSTATAPRAEAVNLPRPVGRGRGLLMANNNNSGGRQTGPARNSDPPGHVWPVSGRGGRRF